MKQTSASYRNYRQWLVNQKPTAPLVLEDYAVPHGGLRAGLVGTREQIAEQIRQFERVGINLLLVECSPQLEEMDRFASTVLATNRVEEESGLRVRDT